MPHNSPKQNTLWLLAALAAPLAHFTGAGWMNIAAAALAVLPLSLLPKSWEGLPKTLALAEAAVFGGATGSLLRYSAACWPSDNDLAVPLTLLALASCTGAAAAPRIGAVLAFCMGLLAIPIAVSGLGKLQPQWLAPTDGGWMPGLITVLLLPNLPVVQGRQRGRRAALIWLLAILSALLVQGTISAPVAAAVPDPFYQTARTLGYLEPVAAAGMTLGWYAAAVLLLGSASAAARGAGITGNRARVLAAGTAAGFVVLPQQPEGWFWAVLTAVLWVLIPFLHKWKEIKKSEN